ncbi:MULTISPECIES: DUF5460 family protein [spotted fever group]|uniref:Uncharacterized protein n=1 Tax=Rickettsia tamurae subsp. buchneri TaxID=1462938 RepID=A0A8E1BZZ8_9RICK|nr:MULTISPECIES: DUF5460 family protein [spotted fever group]EER21021.1 tRNA modification GTPase TrmE [Rickettsia endosymbiont of Ixodes scapularis]KDO02961.1 hypothetical protein REISMN_04225 [Rickettsia tamurae subsp. buchneri]
MAPILNINLNCFMPIFANKMVSSLPGNTKHIIYKLGNTILSSVYNTVKGSFTNGYLVENIKCNWAGIYNHLTDIPNDLSAVIRECTGIKIPIKSIVTYGNSTSVILEEGKHLLQNNTLVELKECTTTEGEAVLQEHNAKMLVNNLRDILNHSEITLKNAQEAGVEIFNLLNIPVKFTTDNLKIIIDAFNVTLDDIFSTEVGKNILDLLSKPFTEATTSTIEKPNDDTNGGGYTGAYITATVFGVISLGFAAKYGWDWYKGRNIKNENLDLVIKNKELAFVELLHENFKNNAVILDEVIKINNLDDIIKLAKSIKEYEFSILPLTNLNNEIVKLNSPSAIAINLDSSSGILHEICKSLGGDDSFKTISNFASLITIIRTANPKSEEYKESITEIFEIFNPRYTDIDYQNCKMPLLADVSSPSDSYGIEA